MSVLIKGMTMPKNCYECSFYESKYHCHGCHAVPKSFEDMDMWNFIGDDRPQWCPLIEVPPHEDLIDRSALIVDLMDRGVEGIQTDDWHEIQQAIMDSPAIIKADESDMDSFIRIFEEDDEEDGMDSFIQILKD